MTDFLFDALKISNKLKADHVEIIQTLISNSYTYGICLRHVIHTKIFTHAKTGGSNMTDLKIN